MYGKQLLLTLEVFMAMFSIMYHKQTKIKYRGLISLKGEQYHQIQFPCIKQ